RSPCLSLMSTGIMGMCHHVWHFFVLHFIFAREAEAEGSPRVRGQPGLHSGFKASVNYIVRPCLKK
ncbi:hypothetical protein GW7_03595, partial [Heterocephalus glaber]